MSTADLASLISRLETVVNRLESSGGGGDAGGSGQADAKFVEDFDLFVADSVEPYMAASAALGGAIDVQAKCLKSIVDEQRKFLVIASKCSAPKDASVMMKLTAAMGEVMGKMGDAKRKMTNDEKNHVSAACEGVVAFSWVGYPKTPMKHIEETRDSVKFYTNKVLVATKNGNNAEPHKNWVNAYLGIFEGLHSYIKDNHRTGLSWNAKDSAKPAPPPKPDHLKASSSSFPLPPPPPLSLPGPGDINASLPPPPPPLLPAPQGGELNFSSSDAAPKALFAEINKKGLGITGGLKKVTNDMKTHKNPDLRKHGPVPFKAKEAPSYKPMGKPQVVKKPPKLELEGKKWIVEYQENQNQLVIDAKHMRETIYIYKCNKSALIVKGKINSIVIDSCKKFGVAFDSVVSGVEVINSESVKVQAQGTMPNCSIDKTDGCIVYLSKECMDCQIVCAKSSEMNVSKPVDDDSGEFEEFPICEQYRTYWCPEKKTFVCEPAEQMG